MSRPQSKVLIADRFYDADWLREALEERANTPVIPAGGNRRVQVAIGDHI